MQIEEHFFTDPKNWVMIAFFLFFILFGTKLWRALASILDARTSSVKADLEEASRLRREAEALLDTAERQRADALMEAKALIERARSEAGRLAEVAAADAEAAAERRERMAIDRIGAAEKVAVDEVRLAAADIAITAARQIMSDDLHAESGSRLVDQAIAQLPAALSTRRAA
jgi:F-type H+-transporting ATPase subunit b